jgi:hypothetical protein
MKQSIRRLAIGVAVTIAAGLLLLIALPLVFRGRLEDRLKATIGSSVDARVNWNRVGLSVLRDFPNVTLSLDEPTVVGMKPFDADTLITMRRARLVLDLRSVLGYLTRGANIVVRDVSLEQPTVNLRVLADGRANWNITRPAKPTATREATGVGVTLRNLRIADGVLSLDDRQSHLEASIKGLHETLSGDFARQRFVLVTRTRIDTASVRFAGIPFLSRARIQLDANVDADLAAHRFVVAHDTLRLNNLLLAFAGTVTTDKPDVGLDLTFNAPSTAFRDILSLVPVVYTRDFARMRTGGSMALTGRVRGAYGTHAFPSFVLDARGDNGAFQYPGLPLPARAIAMTLAIRNPGGHVDSTTVEVDRFHAIVGERPVEARLRLRTPVSDPDVDLRLVGSVQLEDLARTVKLEGVSQLAGLVTADVATRARVSDVDAKRYVRVDARGSVTVSRLALRADSVPYPITVDTATLQLTPRTAELSSLAARIGNSDVRATGSLDNLLSFALHGDELRGTATVKSTQFDLNEWRSKEKTTEVIPVPPRIDFVVQASADRVLYGPLTATNVHGDLRVKDQRVTVKDLNLRMLRGGFVANGFYETTIADRPTFDVALRIDTLDVPAAFAALVTVQKLAPVAKWATGSISGAMGLGGPLDKTMMPIFTALTGKGTFDTERLAVEGMPVLERVAEAFSIDRLRNPALGAMRISYDLAGGRMTVKPFTVKVADIDFTVGGSHGIDQTLRYDLALAAPRALLGSAANATITRLAAQAGKIGADISAGDVVRLKAHVGGTVSRPTVTPSFAGTATTLREAAQTAVKEQVVAQVDEVKQRADSALEETRRRARAEADRIIAEAQRQADTIRTNARALAEKVKQAANARADSLVARATNPVAKKAAQLGTDRIRREAEQQADRLIREADARADALVADAKRRGEALVPP